MIGKILFFLARIFFRSGQSNYVSEPSNDFLERTSKKSLPNHSATPRDSLNYIGIASVINVSAARNDCIK
jgi:hypothetical protein